MYFSLISIKNIDNNCNFSHLGGTTVHTGLNMKYGRDYWPLSDEEREKTRLELEDLELIIIDEMSMISADMLYMIHKRLCEIFVSEDLFAGKALLLVGDLMQLKPVKGVYLFEKPKNKKYKSLHQASPLWHNCEPFVLETNFRQGEGSEWNAILNRARVGELTERDKEILEQRRIDIRNDKEIYYESAHVFWTNAAVENFNLKKLNELPSPLEEINAKIIAPRGYRPKISKHGTIDDTQFRKKLKLKIGARVMLTLNTIISDSLVNGSIGTLVDIVKKDGKIIAILIQFDNEEAGRIQRAANKHFLNENFPNATPIFPSTLEYIPKNRKGNAHGIRVKITQFALRLSWASTCHRIQGITVPEGQNLVAHGHARLPTAMGYVMMGRVSKIENLYLSDSFNLDKVKCNEKALLEKQRLDELFSNHVSNTYDLIFVNIRSLRAHHEDLLLEPFVQSSKIIALAETWTYQNEDDLTWADIPGKQKHFASYGKGKGCGIYHNDEESLKNVKNFQCENFQILSGLYNEKIQVFVLYLSKEANFKDIIEILQQWMIARPTIVIGDFNYQASEENMLSTFLHSKGLMQIVKRPTHVDGGIIDHCYVPSEWKNTINAEYFFTYYTDHARICLSFPPKQSL